MFSKRVSNAIRTYQHAKTPRTKQNSIDYIERNFKKYQKYMELPISDKCCDKLKKEPLRRKAKELGMKCVILGILASESYQREKAWLEYGCNVFYQFKDNQCKPLSFWTQRTQRNPHLKRYVRFFFSLYFFVISHISSNLLFHRLPLPRLPPVISPAYFLLQRQTHRLILLSN